ADGASEILNFGVTTLALNADATLDNVTVGGVTVDVVYVSATGTLTITHTDGSSAISKADALAVLEAITYQNDSDDPSTATARTFTVTVNDGVIDSDAAVSTITVAADNDAPVNTVPGTQTIAKETTTAIGGISISDSDAGVANLSTQLQVSNGILNVTLSGGATIIAGFNGTGDLTILGSVTDINNTLASLTYTGDTDVIGTAADTLIVTTNDLGNTGGGGAQQDIDNIQIDLTAVSITANDASADETGSDPGQFTVDLGAINNTGGNVTINYTVTGTATDGGTDYTTLTGSVVIADGAKTATIDVTGINDDALVEGDETVIVTLDSTDNVLFNIDAGNNADTVTIGDNDTPLDATLSVSVDGDEEGPVAMTFRVDLSATNNTGSTLTYDLADLGTGSATTIDDYADMTGAQITVADGAAFGT
ncbi:MAG: hypothetical protein GY754_23205, partial [bacterium]|nr:hypothetical protein [bacterium]